MLFSINGEDLQFRVDEVPDEPLRECCLVRASEAIMTAYSSHIMCAVKESLLSVPWASYCIVLRRLPAMIAYDQSRQAH